MRLLQRPSTAAAIAASAGLALAACSSAEVADPDPSATPTVPSVDDPSTSADELDEPDASPSPTATGDDSSGYGFTGGQTCAVDAGTTAAGTITLQYPADWVSADDCLTFDSEEITQGSDNNAVMAEVVDLALPDAIERAEEPEERALAVVDGHQAVRDVVETELGPFVIWRVDLDPGQDDQPGTFRLAARNVGVVTTGIADTMMLTAELDSREADPIEGATIVGRAEGGGTPWTAVLTDQACAQLYSGSIAAEPASEQCLDLPSTLSDDAILTGFVKFGPEDTYAVGYVGQSVTSIRTEDGTRHLAIPTADGRRAIALPATVGDEVELVAGDGSVLRTVDLT